MFDLPKLWLGSEDSYFNFYDRRQMVLTNPKSVSVAMDQMRSIWDEDEDEGPTQSMEERLAASLIEVYDGVGVITVRGSLVNEESFWNVFMGDVAYGTIVRAVNQLLEMKEAGEVHSAIISYASGGGNAEGVDEAGDSIKAASQIMPIYSHTSSSMLSAAYWLGVSGSEVRSTKMAETGSIGAVATFLGMSRRLKEAGIDPYISRSTPLKAVPHPAEPITELGKQQIDKDVQQLHGFFIDHVLANRSGLSTNDAVETWASGTTFYGTEALQLGLVDGPLITLNDLITQVNQDHNTQSSGDTNMSTRVVLKSEKDRARLATGTPLSELGVTEEVADEVELSGDTGAADVDLSGAAADEPVVEGKTELEAKPVAAQEDGLTTYLRGEVADLKAENATLKTDLAAANSSKATAEQTAATAVTMRPALELSIERLQVTLGHRALKLEGLPIDSLVTMFNQLNGELMQLPVGAQTVQTDAPREEADSQPASMADYRLRMIPKTA